MNGQHPSTKHPMEGFPRVCFIKNTVRNPNIVIGDYTYYDDPDDSENFERNVLYHFPHDALDVREKFGRWDIKDMGELKDRLERRTLQPSFQKTDICAVIAALISKHLLRKATLFPCCAQNYTESLGQHLRADLEFAAHLEGRMKKCRL